MNGVINTFRLKVESCHGTLDAELDATDPFIFVDEMHFTNVIFNLLDNAVKYKRADVDIKLKVRTWNEANKLHISVEDNGIGIKKENLKRYLISSTVSTPETCMMLRDSDLDWPMLRRLFQIITEQYVLRVS